MDPAPFDTLLVRMDKIGDLVLSLPADQSPSLRGRRFHWLIAKGTEFVAANTSPARPFTAFAKRFSPLNFWRLVRWLKVNRPQTTIVLYAPPWVAAAIYVAGIPQRVGRLSQWWSFLFFNYGIRQRRSLGAKHETDYNVDLIEHGLAKVDKRVTTLPFAAVEPLHLAPPDCTLPVEVRGFVVVHPGMAGSALNWPAAHYVDLIKHLARNHQVVITGTALDRAILSTIKGSLNQTANVVWCDERLSTAQLLNLLSQARAVVAPSTGVLHLAASLGVPSVGIYSPIAVQSPTRWGPRGPKVRALTPPKDAVGLNPDPSVMSAITVDHVLTALHEMALR